MAFDAAATLQIDSLSCIKGDRLLFKNLSFSVKSGQVLRIAGENGSGKTTLLRMLCGLVAPQWGSITWCGKNINKQREPYLLNSIYIAHQPAINSMLSALDNLYFSGLISGEKIDKNDCLNALSSIGLSQQINLPTGVLSQGQRKRVSLARLYLSLHKQLWILDEPFNALDVAQVANLTKLIEQHVAQGGMVILVTHNNVPLSTEVHTINLGEYAC